MMKNLKRARIKFKLNLVEKKKLFAQPRFRVPIFRFELFIIVFFFLHFV